jgi:hypothetical protein
MLLLGGECLRIASQCLGKDWQWALVNKLMNSPGPQYFELSYIELFFRLYSVVPVSNLSCGANIGSSGT